MTFVAGLKGADRREFLSTGFDVSETAVDGRKLGAEAEDDHIDGMTAKQAEAVFSGGNDATGQARALMSGIDGKLSKVATRAISIQIRWANFEINTGKKLA